MTMDKSLRTGAGLVRSRSVYNRAERIARLQQAEKWKEGDSPFGLPKVRVYKLAMKKKKKKAKEEEGEGAAAAPGTAAAPAAAAAAPAKGAPAKGAPAKGAPKK
jgi:small basic protein (TIGR04137 family)